MTPEDKRRALAALLLRRGAGVPSFHPLSHGQRALWLLHRIAPSSATHHIGIAFALRGQVDAAILRKALDALVARHASLRTVFELRDGAPVQRVEPAGDADLADIAIELSDGDVVERLGAEVAAPFDLQRGPLLRTRLFRRAGHSDILLLAVHHIICDGWSLWILLDELRALYTAEFTGFAVALPPLRHGHAEFAHWEAALLASPAGHQLWEHWCAALAGGPTVLELPAPTRATDPEGRSLPIAIDPALAHAVGALAERTGTTRFMILLAAFQVLLHRITGQDDFVVGCPFLGRPSEYHGVVGLFANILPLRAEFAVDLSFEQFLVDQVRPRVLGAIEHQALPFSVLVQRLGVPRELDRVPLVQVVFAYQKPQRNFAGWAGLLEPIPLAQRAGYFDLVLELADSDDQVAGSIKFRRDRLDGALADRLAAAYQHVLAQVLVEPSRSLRSVRLLGEREQRTLIDEYSTGPVVGAPACVADRFLAQAERAPDAVALSRNGHTMSYRELRARVLELAGRLHRHGIGAQLRVAIFAHRSFELIVGILGALEAGATYVPIDPSDPVERIAFLLDDAAPALVLVQAGLTCPAAVPTLALDTGVPVDDARHEPVQRRPGPRDAAYLIYTSGSTGAPRGVLVEHGSLANLVSAQAEAFRAAVGTRVLQFASPSFDASVSEIFVALCHGATLCLASHDELLPGPALIGLLERERIHVFKMPPSALAALPEAPLPDLTTIMAAGECCPEEVVARWSTGRTFVNVYGPTETTVCAALGPCVSGDGTPTVGRPLANVRLYVLDAAGELAPVGVTGELYIAGAGVARGYWNRPDATAERFLPDRFAGAPARMYRTGDLARWRLDGRLEILGRRDRQLKVRGYRIEPAEIESVLLAHPAVAEAVVGALPGPGGHLRLIGWCVLRPDGSATPAELRAHLCQALPSWMAPALLIAVPRIPRTPRGKVDLRALPADLPRGEIRERDLGEVERAILETWSNALGASADRALTFFEQGGDSLLLVIAHERLQRRLGRQIAIADLLRFPSAPALAAWLELGAESTPAPRADVRATRRAGQAQLRRTRTSHRDASPEPPDD